MDYANLDMITRRSLLERGLPIHYYIEYLSHHAAAIRELSKDTLHLVNTVYLPINSYGAVTIPSDFVDEVLVQVPLGQGIKTLVHQDWITPLRHKDATGAFAPYGNKTSSQDVWTLPYAGWGVLNMDSYGQPTGRFFGAKGGTDSGYKVLRERNEIQLSEDLLDSGGVVLIYVGSGQSADNATRIDFRAFAAIQAYADWKTSRNYANNMSAEARNFYNEQRRLKQQMNELTIADIRNILASSYTAAIKNV